MKAAHINETGGPEVIQYGEQPQPEPGPNEVLVKVGAVAVNPIDTYIRGGMVAMPLEFPYIIGCDLAGTVEKCGADAAQLQPGQRVWGSNQGLFGRRGSFAEYVACDAHWLYPTPEGESDEEAAAGALVGVTAHLGLFLHAALEAGETLFVNGGAGGVGSCVIQLAKAAGARVITTAGSEEKRRHCLELGAEQALDYRSPTLDDDLRSLAAAAGGIDVWFETQRQPTFDRTVDLMAKRGRIVLMAGRDARPEFPVGPFYVKDLRMCGFAMFNASPAEQQTAALAINADYEAGAFKPQIGKTFPLEEAAAAHRLQEDNTLNKQGTLSGKIVLVP